jgi:hypothetical protein
VYQEIVCASTLLLNDQWRCPGNRLGAAMCPALMILMTMFVAPRILDNVGLGAAGMPCLFKKRPVRLCSPKGGKP